MDDDDPIATGLDPSCVLPARIAHWAEAQPSRPFLAEVDGPECSFGETRDGMLRWASLLRARGVRAGDRVVSFLPPSIAAHLLWLGAACIGALEVGVNPELRGALLDHVLGDASPVLCVGLAEHASLAPAGTPFVEATGPVPDVAPMAPPAWPGPTDAACVIYTSGTTGPAKGVVLPWAQLSATIGRIPRSSLGADDAVYAPWPMFHVTGRTPLPAMADVGGRVVLRARPSVGRFWPDMVRYGCTSTTFGALAALLLDEDAPAGHRVRWVFMAPRGELSLRVQNKFGVQVLANYGSTEVGFPILNRRFGPATADVSGWPRDGYLVRIVREGRDVADGEPGEMWIGARDRRVMFSGYLGRDGDPMEDGWFRTGDIVTRRADGGIVFVDRMRDIIRRFGENISSLAVESVVATDPDVTDCAALASPSDICGEEVLLVVSPSTVGPEALFERLAARLPRYALPAYIAVRDALPKTPTGKVAKHELAVSAADDGVWQTPAAASRHRR
ncbi:MAG TPA: AMP-binding protein [Acidimicrobiales bacterium]|nr:AMP-binding protein [Acidimicrobiales bacterium]